MKYTINDFRKDFPNNDVCLDYIFKAKYPEAKGYYRVKRRKCYANSSGNQIHPLRQTIFEKSSTPLTDWLYAIFLFSASKNGVAAKELQRQLGVTYKCAHRIAKKIRELMVPKAGQLSGTIEMDETVIGGKKKGDFGGHQKETVIGMVSRGGDIKAIHSPNRETHTIINIVTADIALGSRMITDDYPVYRKLKKLGHKHQSVNHSQKEYARGLAHTNTIEGFWSQLKRSLHGTYHAVSPKYLQSYVDEFAWRYNYRQVPGSLFRQLLARV